MTKSKILYVLIFLFITSCSDNSLQTQKVDNSINNKEDTNTKKKIKANGQVKYDDLADFASFTVDGRRWHDYTLTYYFSSGTSDITGSQEEEAIRDALELWSNSTDFTFSEINSQSNADIVILWANGSHGDGNPFDGVGGVLAHAFFPPPNGGSYAGDMHFDDDETWTKHQRSNNSQPRDLVTVAAHELGHSLGLGHSQVGNALMYPYYDGSHRYLAQDDIDGINSIYPLEVVTGGPTAMNSGDPVSFNSSVYHEEGEKNYTWYYWDNSTQYWVADGNTKNYVHTWFNLGPGNKQAKVKIEVTSAGETSTDMHSLTILPCSRSGGQTVGTQDVKPC